MPRIRSTAASAASRRAAALAQPSAVTNSRRSMRTPSGHIRAVARERRFLSGRAAPNLCASGTATKAMATLPRFGPMSFSRVGGAFVLSPPYTLGNLATACLENPTLPYMLSSFYGLVGPGTPRVVPNVRVAPGAASFAGVAGRFVGAVSYCSNNVVTAHGGNIFDWDPATSTALAPSAATTTSYGASAANGMVAGSVAGPYVQVDMSVGTFGLEGVAVTLGGTVSAARTCVFASAGGGAWDMLLDSTAAIPAGGQGYLVVPPTAANRHGSGELYKSFRVVFAATSPAASTLGVVGVTLVSSSSTSNVLPSAATSNGSPNVAGCFANSSAGYSVAGQAATSNAFNYSLSDWLTLPRGYPGVGYGANGAYVGNATTTNSRGKTIAGEWIELRVPSAVQLSSLQLATPGLSGGLVPASLRILGSNDNRTFFNVATVPNVPAVPGNVYPVVVNSPAVYSTYRTVVTSCSSGPGNVQLALFGVNASQDPPTYRSLPPASCDMRAVPATGNVVATATGVAANALSLVAGVADPYRPYTLSVSSTMPNTSPLTLLCGGDPLEALPYWATPHGTYRPNNQSQRGANGEAVVTTANIVRANGSNASWSFPGEWIDVTLTGSIVPRMLRLSSPSANTANTTGANVALFSLAAPKWFTWLGSADNGVTWYELFTQSASVWNGPDQIFSSFYDAAAVGGPTAFSRFRVVVRSIGPNAANDNVPFLALDNMLLIY